MWLFRNKVVVAASICTFVSGGLMFGINSYVPLFAQGVRGGSAMDAGLIVLRMSVTWPLGSVLAGRIMIKRGYYVSAISGALMLVAGSALLLPMRVDTSIVCMPSRAASLGSDGLHDAVADYLSADFGRMGPPRRGDRDDAVLPHDRRRHLGRRHGRDLTSQLQSNLADVPGVPTGITSQTLFKENTRRNLDPGVLSGMQEALANALHEVYSLVLLSAIPQPRSSSSSSRAASPQTSRTAPAPSPQRRTRSRPV